MIRQLLAVFAMLTGLASVAEPAQARVAAVESVRLADAREASCSVPVAQRSLRYSLSAERPRSTLMCPRRPIILVLPPLMLQVDRAHE